MQYFLQWHAWFMHWSVSISFVRLKEELEQFSDEMKIDPSVVHSGVCVSYLSTWYGCLFF